MVVNIARLWLNLQSFKQFGDGALIDIIGQVGDVRDVGRTLGDGLVVHGHAPARRTRRRRQHHRRPGA